MKSRAERKARTMEIAEKEIEKLLDWRGKADRPDLSRIEEEVLRIRKRIGEGMAREVIESQEARRPVPSSCCPECQKEMHSRMRWSRKGLQRLIPIRAAVLSDSFDLLWASVFNSPTN